VSTGWSREPAEPGSHQPFRSRSDNYAYNDPAAASVAATAFLVRYFRNRNLIPFGIYCLAFGAMMIVYLAVS
jgi:hypothetical protein